MNVRRRVVMLAILVGFQAMVIVSARGVGVRLIQPPLRRDRTLPNSRGRPRRSAWAARNLARRTGHRRQPTLRPGRRGSLTMSGSAGLAVVGVVARCLGSRFGHVLTLLGLAVVLRAGAVIDLRARVDPDLSGTTAGGRRRHGRGCGRLRGGWRCLGRRGGHRGCRSRCGSLGRGCGRRRAEPVLHALVTGTGALLGLVGRIGPVLAQTGRTGWSRRRRLSQYSGRGEQATNESKGGERAFHVFLQRVDGFISVEGRCTDGHEAATYTRTPPIVPALTTGGDPLIRAWGTSRSVPRHWPDTRHACGSERRMWCPRRRPKGTRRSERQLSGGEFT